jgi:endo-1,4-beta-xylanase
MPRRRVVPAADATTTPSAISAAQPAPDLGYTPELEQKQVAQYKMVFDIFREYKNVITGVTFWNVSDRYSWLDFRGGGIAGGAAAGQATSRTIRKAYPLLFDENRQRKKAYYAVTDF